MKNLLIGLIAENSSLETRGDSTFNSRVRQIQSKTSNLAPTNYQFSRDAEKIRDYFDAEWYLATYTDVNRAQVDPLLHYLKHGHCEDRDPSPYFSTSFYREHYLGENSALCPLIHFAEVGLATGARPHPLIDISFISQKYHLRVKDVYRALLDDSPQFDCLSPWFSKSLYRELHQDVHASGVDPLTHMTKYGISELRKPHPGYSLLKQNELVSQELTDKQITLQFTWEGRGLTIVGNPIPAVITAHVVEQGKYDSQVFSPGYQSLENLTQIRATNVPPQRRL